ncbi:hypothetical protein KC19_6G193400 [Ceratodon purpureus]|uniref:Uncharacterized protein n=1 Tax=Ceratodon purpureus TaxID=3225 RepID=A0A8T0HJA4_CERPU|nr:hypothetical protein KC19_6G193400 [Ceratodon purpureus]
MDQVLFQECRHNFQDAVALPEALNESREDNWNRLEDVEQLEAITTLVMSLEAYRLPNCVWLRRRFWPDGYGGTQALELKLFAPRCERANRSVTPPLTVEVCVS